MYARSWEQIKLISTRETDVDVWWRVVAPDRGSVSTDDGARKMSKNRGATEMFESSQFPRLCSFTWPYSSSGRVPRPRCRTVCVPETCAQVTKVVTR